MPSLLPAQQAADGSTIPLPTSTADALHAMFADATTVFAGEVIAIEGRADGIDIRWRVDDAIRGLHGVNSYVLHEWAGLWSADGPRYFVGERGLVFLRAPSVAGFASPVGDMDGVIPLRGDAIGGSFELRWIAQHVATAGAAVAGPASRRNAEALLRSRNTESALPPGSNTRPVSPDEDTPRLDAHALTDSAVVLDLLHAWQRDEGARR